MTANRPSAMSPRMKIVALVFGCCAAAEFAVGGWRSLSGIQNILLAIGSVTFNPSADGTRNRSYILKTFSTRASAFGSISSIIALGIVVYEIFSGDRSW